uniref:Secreted protein n=1 Tax=Ascaris lumbricoides TaxID=6252 RepID=A0A0M3HZR4_ASCLU
MLLHYCRFSATVLILRATAKPRKNQAATKESGKPLAQEPTRLTQQHVRQCWPNLRDVMQRPISALPYVSAPRNHVCQTFWRAICSTLFRLQEFVRKHRLALKRTANESSLEAGRMPSVRTPAALGKRVD